MVKSAPPVPLYAHDTDSDQLLGGEEKAPVHFNYLH